MHTHDPVVERQVFCAQRSVDQMEAAWGGYSQKLIPHLQYLGDLYFALSDYAQAESIYLRLLTVVTKSYGYYHRNVASALQMLGEVCEMQELSAEAERYYLWALDVRQRLKESGPELQVILARLANLYRSGGNNPVKSRVIENKLLETVVPKTPESRSTTWVGC